MKISGFSRCALGIGAAVAVLAACSGGTQSQFGPSAPLEKNVPRSGVTPDAIIYTPKNVTIENSAYYLDLNKDGKIDFIIKERNGSGPGCGGQNYSAVLDITTPNGSSVEGSTTDGYRLAAALASGSQIPGGQSFVFGKTVMEDVYNYWYDFYGCHHFYHEHGNWLNEDAYLGLAFLIRGQTHYGWAFLSVACSGYVSGGCTALTATLKGYAFQTKADTSIMAGQK